MLQRQGCHVGHYKKISNTAPYDANAIFIKGQCLTLRLLLQRKQQCHMATLPLSALFSPFSPLAAATQWRLRKLGVWVSSLHSPPRPPPPSPPSYRAGTLLSLPLEVVFQHTKSK